MPFFEMEGYGRDTGRKRRRTYEAKTAEDAILVASTDGTIIDTATVRRVYPIRHFYSRVAGVTHYNRDGSHRQVILPRCTPREGLLLQREPRNKFSSYAVAVLRQTGEQLGYLPDDVAEDVAQYIKAKSLVYCYAKELTGGNICEGKGYYGLNLLLVVADDPDTTPEAIQEYFASGEIDWCN